MVRLRLLKPYHEVSRAETPLSTNLDAGKCVAFSPRADRARRDAQPLRDGRRREHVLFKFGCNHFSLLLSFNEFHLKYVSLLAKNFKREDTVLVDSGW